MTMQIIRWNPMREVAHMHDEIMREWLRGARTQNTWMPACDVTESEDAVTLYVDLPGIAVEDVTIEIHDDVLSLSGERARPEGVGNWQRVERPSGRFARAVRLPEGIDPTTVTAGMDRGLLTITVPKSPKAQPHRVEITEVIDQGDA